MVVGDLYCVVCLVFSLVHALAAQALVTNEETISQLQQEIISKLTALEKGECNTTS